MQIKQNLVSPSKYDIKCPYTMKPEYVTFHNTDNDAPAKNEVSYMISNNNQVSFHVAVDDVEAIQGIPFDRNAWHCGDGSGNGNRKSIGVEICYNKLGASNPKFKKAEANAVIICAQLLKKYGLGIDRLKPHKHWSGKNCPSTTNHQDFINRVKAELNGGGSTNPPTEGNTYPNGDYNCDFMVTADELNVRTARPDANGNLGDLLGSLKKGEKIVGGYCLNNWMGVILNGKQGFVNATYLTKVAANVPSTSHPYANGTYNVKGRVTADVLNVRKGRPGDANYNTIVTQLKQGQVIEVGYCLNGWFSTYDCPNSPGFLSGEFIQLVL